MNNLINVTKDNYYDSDTNKQYMSCSQFKDFLDCPNKALAKIRGDYVSEKTKPLLVGGYIDSYFSNELSEFTSKNPEIFKKDGTLLKEFEQANKIIQFIEQDPMLMQHLSGEKQVIMVGEISGVPFKIKIDSYFPNELIVDQKIMKDLENVWSNKEHKYVDFIHEYGYDIQGAIYQEIVRQNIGKQLPFRLAITTKEDVPDKAIIEIDQEYLDKALQMVKDLAPSFHAMKQGIMVAPPCNHCDYCRSLKKVDKIIKYSEFIGETNEREHN